MPSVANRLRLETARIVGALSPAARIELALTLGDAGLQAFCSAQGLSRDEGLRRLQRQRQQGRRPSACRRLPPP